MVKMTNELIKLEHEIWIKTKILEGCHLPKDCTLKNSVNDLFEDMPHCNLCNESLIPFESIPLEYIEYYKRVIEIRLSIYEENGYFLKHDKVMGDM